MRHVLLLIAGTPAGPYIDGGKVDRTALKAWRDTRRQNMPWGRQPAPALVHLIDRSSQLSGADDVAATGMWTHHMYTYHARPAL